MYNIYTLIIIFIIAILLFFFFVWMIQLTYNGSIRKMIRKTNKDDDNEIEKINYWTAMIFVFFLTLISSTFGIYVIL